MGRVFECAMHSRGRQESPHLSNEFVPRLWICFQCLQSLLNDLSKLIIRQLMIFDPAKWLLTQEMLERKIAKARKAKAEHSGKKGKNRRRIGLCPS